MSNNHLLDTNQSGFRRGHSTERALLSVTEALWIAKLIPNCNNVRKEGRKRTGLAWEDSGDFYSDKLKQLRTLRALKTSTLSVVSAITLSIRFGCLPLTDREPESSLRLSPRVPTPRWLY